MTATRALTLPDRDWQAIADALEDAATYAEDEADRLAEQDVDGDTLESAESLQAHAERLRALAGRVR